MHRQRAFARLLAVNRAGAFAIRTDDDDSGQIRVRLSDGVLFPTAGVAPSRSIRAIVS